MNRTGYRCAEHLNQPVNWRGARSGPVNVTPSASHWQALFQRAEGR